MQSININKTSILLIFTIITTIFVSLQLHQSTIWGVGLSSDSVTYIEGAKSILKNQNFKQIGDHYPPLYFILIAITTLLTDNAINASKILQFLALILNSFFISIIVWKGTQKSLLPTIICSLLFATSMPVLYIHTMAWTEGIFCFFMLSGFYALANYIKKNNFQTLFIASIFISLAFLTRYVGITLVITGILVIFLYTKNNIEKTKKCLYFSLISLLPMLLWLGSIFFLKETIGNRNLIYHPITIEKLQAGLQVLLDWFFIPHKYPFVFIVLLFSIATIFLTTFNKKNQDKTFEIFLIFIFVYISFIIFSISLFDAHTPLDLRVLFPIHLSFTICLTTLAYRVCSVDKIKNLVYILYFLLFILSYAQLREQINFSSWANTNGIGFASKKWAQSKILQKVKKIDKNIIIYSNGPDAIKILTDRQSEMIPRVVSPTDKTPNKNFQNDIRKMSSTLSKNKGFIVYLNDITWRWYLPTMPQLEEILNLNILYKDNDGIIAKIKQ